MHFVVGSDPHAESTVALGDHSHWLSASSGPLGSLSTGHGPGSGIVLVSG